MMSHALRSWVVGEGGAAVQRGCGRPTAWQLSQGRRAGQGAADGPGELICSLYDGHLICCWDPKCKLHLAFVWAEAAFTKCLSVCWAFNVQVVHGIACSDHRLILTCLLKTF